MTGIVFFAEYVVYCLCVIVYESRTNSLKIYHRNSFRSSVPSQQAFIFSPLEIYGMSPKSEPINKSTLLQCEAVELKEDDSHSHHLNKPVITAPDQEL